MKKVEVIASVKYDVIIGNDILKDAGELIEKAVGKCKAAIISDDIVYPLYGETLESSLKSAGFEICKFVLKNGEGSKNLKNYCEILEFLAISDLCRSDIVIALGGGVPGDIAGYAAATYMRGIKFIQIPTTFLAAIDSSVGGKTAVDLKGGKNLAGAFHQPSLVICDINTLSTLPENVFSDGTAEAIKYGVIADEALFSELSSGHFKDNIEDIIAKCVNIKAQVVNRDEHDTGDRQLLNFGHTIGHAIEKCSNFSITHGQAVAIGMRMIAKAADTLGLSDGGCEEKIKIALQNNNLPLSCSYNEEQLSHAAFSDKKRDKDTINFIIPEKIGHCFIKKIPCEDIIKIISAGV